MTFSVLILTHEWESERAPWGGWRIYSIVGLPYYEDFFHHSNLRGKKISKIFHCHTIYDFFSHRWTESNCVYHLSYSMKCDSTWCRNVKIKCNSEIIRKAKKVKETTTKKTSTKRQHNFPDRHEISRNKK